MSETQQPNLAEWIIIKALYTNPHHLINVAEQLDVRDFTNKEFRIIYTAIKKLAASNTVVNGESIMALLQTESPKHYDDMVAIGGSATLDTLYDAQYKTLISLDEHVRTIRERADNQKIVDAAIILQAQIERGDANEAALEGFDKAIQAIKLRGRQQDVKLIGHSIDDTLQRILSRDESMVGISIEKKYPKLDKMLRHIQPKRVTVILSNFKSGKSTVLLELAWYMARECRTPLLFCDTELFDAEVHVRLLAKVTQFPMEYILSGLWNNSPQHTNIIMAAKKEIEETPFYWHNVNHMSRSQIVSLVKLSQLKFGIQVVVFDYIKPDVENVDARVDLQIGAKVDMLKESVSKSCNVAVLTAVQMNEDTGRAANSKEVSRLADNVIVLRKADPEKDDDILATHMMILQTSRYTQSGVKVPIQIDFGKQSMIEV